MVRVWLIDMLVPISTVKANRFPTTTRISTGLSYCQWDIPVHVE
jgi:hypothetical protein